MAKGGLDCEHFQEPYFSLIRPKNFPYSLITAFLYAATFSQLQEGKKHHYIWWCCREVGRWEKSSVLCCVYIQWPRFLVEAPSRSTDFSFLVRRSRSTRREAFDCFASSSAVVPRHRSVGYFKIWDIFKWSQNSHQKFCVLCDKMN